MKFKCKSLAKNTCCLKRDLAKHKRILAYKGPWDGLCLEGLQIRPENFEYETSLSA